MATSSPVLRKAELGDIPLMQELFMQTIRQTCAGDYTEAQIEAWTQSVKNAARWREWVGEQHCLLAEIDGQLAGFASLKNGEYVDTMYVHPGFLRRGVANALFAALEEEAAKQGKTALSSDVSITARPFFEKKGFRVIRTNQNERGGEVLINYHMRRD